MSDPKTISPLLDGFILGAPISEHHGVVCCPAIKENTNKKYIVKIISVPASQVQFDALLLAGAYKDPGDAMEYFRCNCEDLLQEAQLLKQLSKIEGFLPYDQWQMEPITRRRLGYEIYLVGSYKRSLEKYFKKHAFTHLEAINLALDLCAALTVCRQSGYLYVDLKPSNIYVSEKKEYRIGDLGFLSLDAIRYASLPERYFSPYTPPELFDPMVSMNLSADTYAVGMILYQLFNDGHLPFKGIAPTEEIPNPCHADYEMAEIIMKAIHPDPEQRWTDPKEMGKAIASYMQRNSVNDIPITPFIPLDVVPEDIVPISSMHSPQEMTQSSEQESEKEECIKDPDSTDSPLPEEANDDQIPPSEDPSQDEPQNEDVLSSEIEPSDSEEPDISSNPEIVDNACVPEDTQSDSEDTHLHESEQEEAEINKEPPELLNVSEEVVKILTKAEDIIAHEIPEEIAFPAEPEQPNPFAFAQEDSEDLEDGIYEDAFPEEKDASDLPVKKKKAKHYEDPTRKNRIKKFFTRCILLILMCCLAVGGYWYYQNAYLQTIDSMTIQGTQDQITVLIDTAIEESRLSVSCSDNNGTLDSIPLQGGKVTFEDLQPYTQYTIQVDMRGFHKLVGKTSDVFTTEAPTQILAFHTIAGTEDGSVILNFTANGDEPDFWNIRYSAEGEEEQVETVTGHSAMITGLTVGKVYTFTLDGGKNFALSGETTVQYLASRLILAENISVSSSTGTDITVHWNTPGDAVVETWDIRFYDGYGFEEQVTVSDNQVLFTGIDPASDYTLEIIASGMTQPSKINITSNPLIVSDFQIDESAHTEMKITWKHNGEKPEGGWVLIYTVDGSGSQIVQCEKASAKISPLIPGANYQFTLQSADGRSVFNNTISYKAKNAEIFKENNFKTESITVDLLKTPEDSDWHFETISVESFTDTFKAGDSASMVLQSPSTFYLPGNKTTVLFVFRDSYGNVLPELVTEVSYQWKKIWDKGDKTIGEIDIPNLPSNPGTYIMELYFNGASVAEVDFSITE